MTRVLVLGGTGWLSSRIAETWRDRGADVTALARGARPSPTGTALVSADRDAPGAYDAVRGQFWDEIVDVSSRADQVRAATTALGDRSAHWTYVSTVSVYADDSTIGADESAPLLVPARPGEPEEYGPQKVAAEDAVRALPVPTSILRPTLIAGVGDPTGRLGYWPAAFARAGAGPVLVPPLDDAHVQLIDVSDVARFAASTERTGTVNVAGDPIPLREVLEVARSVAGHTGEVVEAPGGWLEEHGVGYWAGERSLTLWLPAGMPGFTSRANRAYIRAGGTITPLHDIVTATVGDERMRGLDRPRPAGLTREQELTLIDRLP